jgi:hypothetical protein
LSGTMPKEFSKLKKLGTSDVVYEYPDPCAKYDR